MSEELLSVAIDRGVTLMINWLPLLRLLTTRTDVLLWLHDSFMQASCGCRLSVHDSVCRCCHALIHHLHQRHEPV